MRVKFTIKGLGLIVPLTLVLWACSGSGGGKGEPEPTDGGKDRKAVLIHLADNIIIPSYANFKVKLDAMVTRSEAFRTKPDAGTLSAYRTAWTEAYIEWQKVELFEVGPGFQQAIRNFYNIYPASVSGIEANIANPTLSLETTSSYDRQGFPALDYLLNGVGATDTEVLAYYTSADGAKRLAYIKRITDHMQTLLTAVINGWAGSYRDQFTSKTGVDVGSPMGELVNQYVLHYEKYIRSGKFGIPSGAMLNGVVAADKVEAYYKKDISKILAQTCHQAAVDFFNGKSITNGQEGPSFKTYLDALGAKDKTSGVLLSKLITDQFAASKIKIDALDGNFYKEVSTNNQAMRDVYNELQKAVRMLKVDMTSAMSITITYTDNDGD
jgi:predicted lipoprotein